MKAVFLAILLFLSGCISIKTGPVVETVRPWEGHYYTTNDFNKATQTIELNEGESIWVLSNRTLTRLLQNTGKTTK